MSAARPVARAFSGGFLRFAAGILFFLLWLCLAPTARGADGEDLLSDLKVAYIYNFTRFIEWPENPSGPTFVIGVVGDPDIRERLGVLEREGRQAAGRPIEIRGYSTPAQIGFCEILFVGAAAADRLDAIVRRTAGRATLLVSDTAGFAGRGVAIELFRKPDIFRKTERLRLRIDAKALKDRGLVVSAQLYDVAEVME